jgi:hypothetical protein
LEGVAEHSVVPFQAASFPRGLFYGDRGYASTPFDHRVPLLRGYYCPACCDLVARITMHAERVDWTNFGRPDTGTRGWRPSRLGDHFGAFVFRREQYEAAIDAAAVEFAQAVPAPSVDLAALANAVTRLATKIPQPVLVSPPERAVIPRFDDTDREQLAGVLLPHAKAVVRAATAAVESDALRLGGQDLERVQIWAWELARETARLDRALFHGRR